MTTKHRRPMKFGYMRPPRTCFNKPYEGYSYLEDLMCWCVGVMGAIRPSINIGLIKAGVKRRGYLKAIWYAECYTWIASGDSPTEALETLLLKLIETTNP